MNAVEPMLPRLRDILDTLQQNAAPLFAAPASTDPPALSPAWSVSRLADFRGEMEIAPSLFAQVAPGDSAWSREASDKTALSASRAAGLFPMDALEKESSPARIEDTQPSETLAELQPANISEPQRPHPLSERFEEIFSLLRPKAPAGIPDMSEPSIWPSFDATASEGFAGASAIEPLMDAEPGRESLPAPESAPFDQTYPETIRRIEDHSRNIYYGGAGAEAPAQGVILEDHSSNFYFGQTDELARLTSPGNTPARHRLALEP